MIDRETGPSGQEAQNFKFPENDEANNPEKGKRHEVKNQLSKLDFGLEYSAADFNKGKIDTVVDFVHGGKDENGEILESESKIQRITKFELVLESYFSGEDNDENEKAKGISKAINYIIENGKSLESMLGGKLAYDVDQITGGTIMVFKSDQQASGEDSVEAYQRWNDAVTELLGIQSSQNEYHVFYEEPKVDLVEVAHKLGMP